MNENKGFLTGLGDPASDVAAKVAVAAAGGLLDGIKQSGGDVWGGIVGDRIRFWRIERFCIGLTKTAGKLKDKGIPLEKAKALPYGEMLAIFDGMSKAEEDSLSDLWASLLADAMSVRNVSGLSKKSAAIILEQMSADVARVFIQLAKEDRLNEINKLISRFNHKEFFPLSDEENRIDEGEIRQELDNVESEVVSGWEYIFDERNFSLEHLDLVKNELLRLNLIEAHRNLHYFDPEPFRRGYVVSPPD